MAKLRLDLEALVVDSFAPVTRGMERGTVGANQMDPLAGEIKRSQSNCDDCYHTLIGTCMSCDQPVCTMASKTECPSCFNSCGDCGPTCACPVEPAPSPVPINPRTI